MKKAFTLIELLVVIAIIAILAAILFPVFAQAKAAAKQTVALSNCKQFGTATAIYMSDADDNFPLAAVKRPESDTSNWGVGLLYPTPIDKTTIAAWTTPGRIAMAGAFWGNSTYAYTKSYDLLDVPGTNAYTISSDTWANGYKPGKYAIQINGLLNELSSSDVQSPSIVPLFWLGSGNSACVGRTTASPSLDCGAVSSDCRFNPAGKPHPSSNYGSITYCNQVTSDQSACQETAWVFSNHKTPIVRTDTSAKMVSIGTAVNPNVVSTGSPTSDPYAQVSKTGQFMGDYYCDSNGNVVTPGTVGGYQCYFRPDRQK